MTKKTNLKKHLLASASILAIGAFTSGANAADVTIANGVTTAITTGQTVDFTGTTSVVTGMATIANAVTIGAVTSLGSNGSGTVTFAGASGGTTIGSSTASVGVLNSGAGTATISGDIYALATFVTGTGTLAAGGSLTGTTLTFGGAGAATFSSASATIAVTTIDFASAAGVLTVANGANLTGSGGLLSTGVANGTLTFSGATTADSTVTGNIGGAASTAVALVNHLVGLNGSVLTLNGANNFITKLDIGAGQVALNGNWTGTYINFAAAADTTGKVTVATGKTLTGTVTTATTNEGRVEFAGSATVTGNVGAVGGSILNLITINAGAVTTSAGVAATTVNFAADGSLSIAAAQTLQGAVTATTTDNGTLTFAGAGTMTGAIGTSTNKLKLVTVGNGVVTASSNVYATTLNFAGDNAFSIANSGILGSTVTTSTTNTGTLNYVQGATQTGDVGTSTKLLKLINIDSGNNDTATVAVSSGDLYATTLTFVGNSTVTLADNSDITAAITATNTEGKLTASGSSTFTGNIGTTGARLATINIDSTDATDIVRFSGDVFVGTLDATSSTATIRIDQGKTVTATNSITATLAGSSKYQFGLKEVDGGNDLTGVLASDAAILLTFASVDAVVDSTGGYISAGNVYKIVDGTGAATLNGGGASSTATGTATDNSYALSFTTIRGDNAAVETAGVTGDSSQIYLLAARANTYQSASTLTNVKSVGTALEAIANSGDAALDTIHGTLDTYTTAAQVESAVKTLDATNSTSGQTTQALIAVSDAATGTVENRMEFARNETSGVATGGAAASNGVWGEVFGTAIDAGERKGVAGYQANIGGFAIGADTAVNSQTRVGAAFAYGNTDAEGASNETKVDSYQGSIYGTYDMGKVYYEGVGSFAYNSYDTNRTLFDSSVANGSFNGQQYSAKGTAGYKVDVQGGLKVTPFVSAQYTFLTQDEYTETGSNANLHVNSDDINIFKTGLGTKLAYPLTEGGVTYTPRLSAAWYYDLVGDEASTTSNFSSAASTTFVSKGASIARNEFKLGAGLDVLAQDNVTVSLDYSWNTKQDFDAHTGELKARFEF